MACHVSSVLSSTPVRCRLTLTHRVSLVLLLGLVFVGFLLFILGIVVLICLSGKTRLRSDVLCVECDAKLYSLTHSLTLTLTHFLL